MQVAHKVLVVKTWSTSANSQNARGVKIWRRVIVVLLELSSHFFLKLLLVVGVQELALVTCARFVVKDLEHSLSVQVEQLLETLPLSLLSLPRGRFSIITHTSCKFEIDLVG